MPAGSGLPCTLEYGDDPRALQVILCSLSWELQVGQVVEILRRARIPVLATSRDETHPIIIAGGALTLVNPALVEPLADVVIRGDGELAMETLLDFLVCGTDRAALLLAMTSQPGASMGTRACTKHPEPVHAAFTSPGSAFGDMHLVEVMRGCPHGCAFCIMSRRRLEQPVRYMSAAQVLDGMVPPTGRVGLVGPSVLEHPEIERLLGTLRDRKLSVGISSARADRVDRAMAGLLFDLGLKTLTVALDGPSDRIRRSIHKNLSLKDVVTAARNAREAGIPKLKLYVIIGFEGEDDEDIEELTDACLGLSSLTSLALSIGPLVAKPQTPLSRTQLVPRTLYESRIKKLRRSLRQRVKVEAAPWREAHLESILARMTADEMLDLVASHDMSRPFSLGKAIAARPASKGSGS